MPASRSSAIKWVRSVIGFRERRGDPAAFFVSGIARQGRRKDICMAPAKRIVTRRDIARSRRLYEHTNTPVEHIARTLGVSRRVFYARRKQWGWTLRRRSE